jgi:hypothetical protein
MQLYFSIANSFKELDIFFVDRPELRPYFYEGKPMPTDERERASVDATSEMLADLAESAIACGPGLGPLAVDWNKYFAFIYRNSPALRDYWQRYGGFYPEPVWSAFGTPVEDRRRNPR